MNQEITDTIKEIHEKHPDMRYRRLKDELEKKHDIKANDKRIQRKLHLMTPLEFHEQCQTAA